MTVSYKKLWKLLIDKNLKKKDLIRLLYIVDHNLKDTIKIGFHSHNNMQLAYSNAQSLVDFHTKRDLIIDSSIWEEVLAI